MDELIKLAVSKMSGWDFIIAFLIVLFDEYPIKTWIFKGAEKFKALYKYIPIPIGAIVYLVIAFITKEPWYVGVLHGAVVGFAAMGCYDAILKRGKKELTTDVNNLNKAIEEEMKK